MNGLIVEFPFGKLIIEGKRKYVFRRIKPSSIRLGVPIYLISGEKVLGEIIISNCKYNQVKHSYYVGFTIIKKYKNPKRIEDMIELGDWANEVKVNG